MTNSELSEILDGKLDPIKEDISEIKNYIFNGGGKGIRERLSLLEQNCAQRLLAADKTRAGRFIIALTMGGWIVTLIIAVIQLWRK